MKENKYDDEKFFEKYNSMSRSTDGLNGAGEWETLKMLLPDFKGKSVLDLGCGLGWHSAYAAEHGAKQVIGTDISFKMIEKAKKINSYPQIEYDLIAFEDMYYDEKTFDIIISSLMLHYLESFDEFLNNIRLWLKPNGILVFNVEHPIFTAEGAQDWYYENEQIKHFPIDNYFIEGRRDAIFLGEHVVKYHRTITTYLNGLLEKGYRLLNVVEPKPTEKMIAEIDGMKDELRRPMMLIVVAQNIK